MAGTEADMQDQLCIPVLNAGGQGRGGGTGADQQGWGVRGGSPRALWAVPESRGSGLCLAEGPEEAEAGSQGSDPLWGKDHRGNVESKGRRSWKRPGDLVIQHQGLPTLLPQTGQGPAASGQRTVSRREMHPFTGGGPGSQSLAGGSPGWEQQLRRSPQGPRDPHWAPGPDEQ